MANRDPFAAPSAALRRFALSFPESTEDHPWGESAFKVKGKVFLFLSTHNGKLNVTVKLPVSNSSALEMTMVERTAYGLGKHGWVTASFSGEDFIPLDLIQEWIDESYRAVAPKTVLARFEQGEASPPTKPRRRAKKRAK